MKIAYFVNQYPMVSLTFIRREILALERVGVEVARFALRGWLNPVADPADRLESSRTRYVLGKGVLWVLLNAMLEALKSPVAFAAAIRLAFCMSFGSDRTVFHHLLSVAEAAVLAKWLKESGVSHLHAHFGTNSAEVAMYASMLSAIPFSFTVHGVDEWDSPRQLKIVEKAARARFVIAICSFTRAQLFRWIRVEDQHKAHVVHCGIDENAFRATPAELPDSLISVCVGRLCSAKSQHLLVDVVAKLRDRGIPLRLVLVGDGELRATIEARIARHGVEHLVTITGWASEEQVRSHLEAARIMLLPSLGEGLPVAIMEAMALGRPVVASNVGGIAELVRHGIDGWLFPASDTEALADLLEQVLGLDSAQLRAMGMRARERVLARHSITTEAKKLANLFADAPVRG